MPNGARHVLGAAIGLILTPVIAGGLMLGTERLLRGFATFRFDEPDYRLGGLILAGVGLVLGVLVGSRISPLASLIPGVVFSTAGVLWVVSPRWIAEQTRDLPNELARGYQYVGPYGVLLFLGVLLLVASLFPARWAVRHPAPGAGGTGYEQEAPTLPYGQNPAAGQPQAVPGRRPSPYVPGSPPPGSPPEGGAGGWTQMYGSGGRNE
jgi:hypothetical protein